MDKRASVMIANALALGVPDLIISKDIINANKKVNTLFVAAIFNTCHGL
jgi:plastin-1